MPPKAKYTRDEIIAIAYELVREQGVEALTAREVAKRLGTSPSPIFALFRDMEELKAAVKERAAACFGSYMADAERYYPAYKRRGMQWVKFAQEEPLLFRMLFMQDMHGVDLDTALRRIPFVCATVGLLLVRAVGVLCKAHGALRRLLHAVGALHTHIILLMLPNLPVDGGQRRRTGRVPQSGGELGRSGIDATSIMSAAPPKRIASTHKGVMLSSADLSTTKDVPQMRVVQISADLPKTALFLIFIAYIFTICSAAARSISFFVMPPSKLISIS